MKKLGTTILGLLLACTVAQTQSCLPNGITFSTQAEVDGFQTAYPGCHSIGGDITIDGTAIASLGGLSAINNIDGSLNLQNNPQLVDLQGLQNITTVGSNLYLINNDALDSLQGLTGLTTLGGNLNIEDNLNLKNLVGMGSLTMIGGELTLVNNAALISLSGLSNLHNIQSRLLIQDNPVLQGFTGLSGLNYVGLDITISNCPAVQDLAGFQGIPTIFSSLKLMDCSNLQSLHGLQGVFKINGGLTIANCPALTNFSSLENLNKIGGNLSISNVTGGIQSFMGLENLLTIGGALSVSQPGLKDFTGLNKLSSVGSMVVNGNALESFAGLGTLASINGGFSAGGAVLENFTGLTSLSKIGGQLTISDHIKNCVGLEQVTTLGGISVSGSSTFENFTGLGNVTTLGGRLWMLNNSGFSGFTGLQNLQRINGSVRVDNNALLQDFTGLNALYSIGDYMAVSDNSSLVTFSGLENLDSIVNGFNVTFNDTLQTFGHLRLRSIGKLFFLSGNALQNLSGLDSLRFVGQLIVQQAFSLVELTGLSHLDSIGGDLLVTTCGSLESLSGLQSLRSVKGDVELDYNSSLADITGLSNLQSFTGEFTIQHNPSLSACNIYPVCDRIFNYNAVGLTISDNATGCTTVEEVAFTCNALPVVATVRIDHNANCEADAPDTPVGEVLVHLAGGVQQVLRATQNDGTAQFAYVASGPFSLSLPQFPTQNWALCQDTFWYLPDTLLDTIRTNFLLRPLTQCPDLSVDLGLPPAFRGCLVTSNMQAVVRNTGTITAEDVQLAVVMPAVLHLQNSVPPLAGQNGDTLFFDLGDLPPFASGVVNMVVRTGCDSLLIGQTLCLEAFSTLSNPCNNVEPPFSEIRLFSQCMNDTVVRFTLQNVGDLPTQSVHDYVIIEDEIILMQAHFALDPAQTLMVDVPTDGSTYRMEATKYDDGTQTAVALENCGGLTPGLITAYWLYDGQHNYDFDCRQVISAYDSNRKTAIPSGVGPEHLLAANKPIQYTIDFQNTGTDTAFRVLLRDVLPAQLNPFSIHPGYASHPYTWQIVGADTLEVLFLPIALPDSSVNEPASHGWFSFDIDQQPDLPDGTAIENTASIIFDYNPPIATNTVLHTIGEMTVSVDEPQAAGQVWQVLGNPARYAATFRSLIPIPGGKRFELSDAMGRIVRTEHFDGPEFGFRRGLLPGGLYYFRIYDARGKAATGKIVLSD